MALAKPIHRLTEAEYLEIERRAEFKSEFFQGQMFAMAGGTPLHSLIATNFARELGNRLEGGSCIVYNSDLRVKVEACGLYTYPDVTVVCGDRRYDDEQADTIVNPKVIVEVLSDSTEAYDRGAKFGIYRQIPSLQEYLLANQRLARIEHFIRQPGGDWLLHEATGMEATLLLPSLNIMVSVGRVFANVEFPPATLHPERQAQN